MLVALCQCCCRSAVVWNSLDHQDHLNSRHLLWAFAVQNCSFLQVFSVVYPLSHDWKYSSVLNPWKILLNATFAFPWLYVRVGTHFTVVPSRQVVREKVVWGGLQSCWRVMCRIFPCCAMKSPSVPTQSFLLFSPHTSEVSLWFWFFPFLASVIYPVKRAKDNMKIRSLSLRLRPLSSPMLWSPWLHICTVLTNAVIQIAEL